MMTHQMARYFSVTATVALIAAMVCLYQLNALFSPLPVVIAVQFFAIFLMGWARLSFGRRSFYFAADSKAEKLVTSGAYRFMRHPIYGAIGVFASAGVAAHLTAINITLMLFILVALWVRVICEEFCLRQQFSDYAAYAQRTARFIPFVF